MDGLILLQVDDSLGFGSEKFLSEEEMESTAFRCKPRTMITKKPISFNGILIHKLNRNIYTISQPGNITNLMQTMDQKIFSSQRASDQYVGVNTNPDVCAAVQIIAPGNKPTTNEEYKYLNNAI